MPAETTTSAPVLRIPPDEAAYCGNCAYDLRGLTTARCPECGEVLREIGVFQGASSKRRPLICFAAIAIVVAILAFFVRATALHHAPIASQRVVVGIVLQLMTAGEGDVAIILFTRRTEMTIWPWSSTDHPSTTFEITEYHPTRPYEGELAELAELRARLSEDLKGDIRVTSELSAPDYREVKLKASDIASKTAMVEAAIQDSVVSQYLALDRGIAERALKVSGSTSHRNVRIDFDDLEENPVLAKAQIATNSTRNASFTLLIDGGGGFLLLILFALVFKWTVLRHGRLNPRGGRRMDWHFDRVNAPPGE